MRDHLFSIYCLHLCISPTPWFFAGLIQLSMNNKMRVNVFKGRTAVTVSFEKTFCFRSFSHWPWSLTGLCRGTESALLSDLGLCWLVDLCPPHRCKMYYCFPCFSTLRDLFGINDCWNRDCIWVTLIWAHSRLYLFREMQIFGRNQPLILAFGLWHKDQWKIEIESFVNENI